jgi:hypothetical protein
MILVPSTQLLLLHRSCSCCFPVLSHQGAAAAARAPDFSFTTAPTRIFMRSETNKGDLGFAKTNHFSSTGVVQSKHSIGLVDFYRYLRIMFQAGVPLEREEFEMSEYNRGSGAHSRALDMHTTPL